MAINNFEQIFTMSAFAALSSRYTDSVPVITQQRLARWEVDENLASAAQHIKLSDQPSVFQHFCNEERDVVIWRTTIPQSVTLFISAALEKLGAGAAKNLSDLWDSVGTQTLDQQGCLVALGSKIDTDCIVASYARIGMPPALIQPFAEFFLASVQKILANLPLGTTLNSTTLGTNCSYSPTEEFYVNCHADAWPALILNFSDPGTPYIFGNTKKSDIYRTQIGDFVLHGSEVEHGFATAKPERDSQPRPRFFSSFGLGTR